MHSVVPGGSGSLSDDHSTDANGPLSAFSRFFRSKIEQIGSNPSEKEFRSDPILAQSVKSTTAVECWLNERLARDPLSRICNNIDVLLSGNIDSNCLHPPTYSVQRRALQNAGIGRNQLQELGLESGQIDRFYRGLFVYSNGIMELLNTVVPEASRRFWKAYWTLADIDAAQKSRACIAEAQSDVMLRLMEFHDRQLRMSADTVQQRAIWLNETKNLSRTVEEKMSIIGQLESEIASLEKNADSLNTVIAQERQQLSEQSQQTHIWQERCKEYSDDLERCQRDQSEMKSMIEMLNLKRKKVEDQLVDDQMRLGQMQFDLHTLEDDGARYKRRVQELVDALQALQSEHRHNLDRLNKLIEMNQQKDLSIDKLQADLMESTRNLTSERVYREALEQNYSIAVNTIDALNAETRDIQTKLVLTSDQLRTRTTELDRVRLEFAVLREQFEAQTLVLQERTEHGLELQNNLNQAEEESRKKSIELFCRSEKMSNMIRAWQIVRRRSDSEHMQLLDANTKIRQLKNVGDHLRQRIESLATALEEAREQLKAITAQHQREIAQHRHEYHNVCVQRDEYVEMTMALKATQEHLQLDLTNLEGIIAAKNSQIEKHREKIKELEIQAQSLRNDFDVQHAKSTLIETRLKSVQVDLVEALDSNSRLTILLADAKQNLLQSRSQYDQMSIANDNLRRDMDSTVKQIIDKANDDRVQEKERFLQLTRAHESAVAEYEARLLNASEAEKELESLLLARVQQCTALSHEISKLQKTYQDDTKRRQDMIQMSRDESNALKAELQSIQQTLSNNANSRRESIDEDQKRRKSTAAAVAAAITRNAYLEFLQNSSSPNTVSATTPDKATVGVQTLTLEPAPVDVQKQSTETQTEPSMNGGKDASSPLSGPSSRRGSLAAVQVRSPSITSTTTSVTDTSSAFAAAVAPVDLMQLKMKAGRMTRKHRGVRLPPVLGGRAGPSAAVTEAMSANNVWMSNDGDLSMTGMSFSSERHP